MDKRSRPFCYTSIAPLGRCASWLALLFGAAALQACTFGLSKFERELHSARGAEGEVHGANAAAGLYVFTYRNPRNFFDYYELSLAPQDARIASALAELRRHDRVRITGRFMDNPSPQKHIEVSSVAVVKRYAGSPEIPAYDYPENAFSELRGADAALFLVHGVQADGRVLVVEHRDRVLPMFIRRPDLTRSLARNDVVRLHYRLQDSPEQPAHLELRDDVEQPVEVIDSVMALHGKEARVEGALALFPKSPQVQFNVFAVLQDLPGGLRRQYTLANFKDKETFAKIRDKLQAAWDASPEAASGRNKLVSRRVRIRVAGTFNEVDVNQANVQILLGGPDAIEILTR